MLHAVIMAGGAGTRFWPESRRANPKQLLNLTGERSMIQSTVDRLEGLVEADRVMIVTNEVLVEPIQSQLPELPAKAIIGEPAKRDTAPCIGLAAGLVSRDDDAATMVVMPADHVISPPENFRAAIEQAVALVDESPSRLVTFGITPTYAAETFGYVERGEALPVGDGAPAFRVARFREKPDRATAEEYLASGNFYWNSGIFVWRADTINTALATHVPQMAAQIAKITAAWDADNADEVFQKEFSAIEGKSIDYAVMEKAEEVVVIEAPFKWDDVGNWPSLARLHGTDADGNTVLARHIGEGTTGTIIRSSDDHVIATLGLEDMIVVHTADATLVARRDCEEQIRQLVARIEQEGLSELL